MRVSQSRKNPYLKTDRQKSRQPLIKNALTQEKIANFQTKNQDPLGIFCSKKSHTQNCLFETYDLFSGSLHLQFFNKN